VDGFSDFMAGTCCLNVRICGCVGVRMCVPANKHIFKLNAIRAKGERQQQQQQQQQSVENKAKQKRQQKPAQK